MPAVWLNVQHRLVSGAQDILAYLKVSLTLSQASKGNAGDCHICERCDSIANGQARDYRRPRLPISAGTEPKPGEALPLALRGPNA
jgi:hypothetical protein